MCLCILCSFIIIYPSSVYASRCNRVFSLFSILTIFIERTQHHNMGKPHSWDRALLLSKYCYILNKCILLTLLTWSLLSTIYRELMPTSRKLTWSTAQLDDQCPLTGRLMLSWSSVLYCTNCVCCGRCRFTRHRSSSNRLTSLSRPPMTSSASMRNSSKYHFHWRSKASLLCSTKANISIWSLEISAVIAVCLCGLLS